MKNFLFVFLVFICSFFYAQRKVYNEFIHLSISEGLSQSSVIAMEQDQFGQMWIGTRDGLNKYDGERITVYKSSVQDSTAISNNDILSIHEDQEGFIWIGTHKGLNKYDPRLETFTTYLYSDQKGSIADNTIYAITQLNNGELWFGTGNGLMRYNKDKNSFKVYRNKTSDSNSLSSNLILDIYQDHQEKIWIGTSSGLNKMSFDIDKEPIFEHNFNGNPSLGKTFIQTIDGSRDGEIWVGTKNEGIYIVQLDDDMVTKYQPKDAELSINNDVRSLVFDNQNNLWIATYEGLYIKESDGNLTRITHQPGIEKSLSRNTLKKIFIDRKGSVWIGAYYGGVNIWDSYNNNFLDVYRKTNGRAEKLGVVSSIVEDEKGNLYFGTEGKGITVIDKEGVTNEEMSKALNEKLYDTNVKSLLIDGATLWIGTFNRGIYTFDTKSMFFKNESTAEDYNNRFKETSIYSILKSEDYLYLGSFGQGLFIKDLQTDNIVRVTHQSSRPNSLTNNNIRVLFKDKKDNLWIGTEYGVNLITADKKISDEVAVQYFLSGDQKRSAEDILCIYEDYKGNIYVGTKESGLFQFKENQFIPISINLQGLKVSSIYGIVEDDNFNLWMSCDQGIVKYDPNQKETTLYNQNDGFVGNEFKNNACIKKSNGDIYFGSSNGASYFDPTSIEKNKYVPQVTLTSLKVQGQRVTDYKNNEIIDKSIAFVDKITLPHNKSSFSIDFAVPNFINAFNNKYAYRLVGLEDDWKYGNNNQVNYTIQNPGTYIFEVLGANNDNVWNTSPTRLEITIKPSPWRSPLAFLAYSLAIVFALFGFNRINKAKTELKHKLELEHLENIRQEEINQSKLQFFTNISHEFRTPLALILGPLQQLLENYQGSNKMYKKLLVIERNADQLLKLINQILDFRAFENEHSKLKAAEGNVVKFLKEIYLSFQEFSKISGYNYTFTSSSDEIRVYFDRNKLEKVLFNLLSNAFKNTPDGGDISLNVQEMENTVVIEVIDNGKGIDKEFVDKVFDRFYEIAADQEYQKQFNQGSGIGLSIAKKAVQLHKGTIEVESVKDEGTVFRVNLKKGNGHLLEEEIIKDFKISDDIGLYTEQLVGASALKELDFSGLESDQEKSTILVAEDNDELRKFIADILKEHYTVVQAENGAIAFKKALQKSPDLIISDVIMPEMEGTEFCAKIKNDIRTSHIPFILLTSRTSLVYKVDGLESGADAYISKPFNVKEFLLTIRNLLNSVKKLKERFSSDSFQSDDFTVTSIDEELLKKAIKIVEENISNASFDIPFFSSELGVSRTMLFTKIKGWTGLTPNEFIHSIRMKRASQLLELGEINISEVCYKVGFRNPKYFTKCFKKHFNQTPTEFASKFY